MILPLQPGSVRLMLIRDADTGTIVDAEVFFDGDEAVRARDSLIVGLDGEFRDYRPETLPVASAITDREPLPSGLLPAERLAVSMARGMLERGENPGPNITGVLVLAVDRLAPLAAAQVRLREAATSERDAHLMMAGEAGADCPHAWSSHTSCGSARALGWVLKQMEATT